MACPTMLFALVGQAIGFCGLSFAELLAFDHFADSV
jgi:hypothetical protein